MCTHNFVSVAFSTKAASIGVRICVHVCIVGSPLKITIMFIPMGFATEMLKIVSHGRSSLVCIVELYELK